MGAHTVKLEKGLSLDGVPQLEATLREPTAADLIEAMVESERLVETGDGPQLVPSQSLVGINVLRRQVESIGAIPGPLSIELVRRLTARDLALLQASAERLDTASREVAHRGRDDGAGESGAADGDASQPGDRVDAR